MTDNDDLEVYIFQGNEGEEVPESVGKLIVNHGVQVLPGELCCCFEHLKEVTLPNGLMKIDFSALERCVELLKIKICNTVQYIGVEAFRACYLLTKVEFDISASSPHRLTTIDKEAFTSCHSLRRIKLPPSVTFVGESAFHCCRALIEANLSNTGITQVCSWAFADCSSLQTVCLPNTLERIRSNAFYCCRLLVTVVAPLDSQSITIEDESFGHCKRLENFLLPKGSTAEESSFRGCELLHERYGEESSRIVDGLIGRFDVNPIHRMCYDHSLITVQGLRQCIADQQEEDSLVDEFGMTPFHVLFSTAVPSIDLLEVLLESLPNQLLKRKDANDRRPLAYLINNWTDGTKTLFQRTLQKWMIDPLARWGTMSSMEAMQRKVQEILAENDKEQRATLCDEACSALEHYENVEATSILEMALWKGKLKSGWSSDGSKRQALDREECRCLCGSDVVIPRIVMLLGIPRGSF